MDKRTKLLIGLGAAAALLLGLIIGGVGKSPSTGSSGTSSGGTSQDVTPPAPVQTDDDIFINLVRSYGNKYIDNADDYQLIQIAQTTCETFDAGFTYEEIVNYLATNGDTTDLEFYEMEGILIGAAVNVYCPEYLGQIS